MSARRLRVAALTGGRNVPSARFRVRQLILPLRRHGIEVREFIPLLSSYPPAKRWLRPVWGGAALGARAPAVLATHRHDVTLLQRELISTFVTLEPLTRRPRVLDVDDAIFLHRGGRFAERLACHCDWIICGNEYLAEHFGRWNKNVSVIPTAVDTHRYVPGAKQCHEPAVIGWIGTGGNLRYVYNIETALNTVLKERPDVILRIISDSIPCFKEIPKERIEFISWAPEKEVEAIQRMTIGIMPLENSAWERGKCSYKMLQYMACRVPVVASPVGMNAEVLSMAPLGLSAITQEEWVEALLNILSNPEEAHRMGEEGRSTVERHFDIDVIAPHLASCLAKLA